MNNYKDLTGQKFGKLTVLSVANHNGAHKRLDWLCRCDCGNEVVVEGNRLRSGNTKSCGCLKNSRQGRSRSRLYSAWFHMIRRCYNPQDKNYDDYGGRGIGVCTEWRDSFNSFATWSLQNGFDDALPGKYNSLDRIDNNGNYCPDNCRWVPMSTQANNRRPMPSKHMLTYDGQTHSISQWAEIVGLTQDCIYDRVVKYGWSVADALTKTPRKHTKHSLRDNTGREYTIKELSEITGFDYDLIYRRTTLEGWTADDILSGGRAQPVGTEENT